MLIPIKISRPVLPGRDGHDIGEPDGMIGARTREALKQVQGELGLVADGRAGQAVLQALRDAESR